MVLGQELVAPPAGETVLHDTASLSAARYEHTATLLPKGQLLVAVGRNGGGDLASAEVYEQGPGR